MKFRAKRGAQRARDGSVNDIAMMSIEDYNMEFKFDFKGEKNLQG